MTTLCQSKPRLRTRTGCMACRRRRKKCDEELPQCGGCRRNGLECIWPTAANQPVDGRRHRSVRRRTGGSSCLSISPSIMGCTPFQTNDHFHLYQHYATTITSRLVRQNCRSEYADQSRMLQMALEFPPLMGIMVAIAALDLGTPDYTCFAARSYIFSLQSLRNQMAVTQDAGNEDSLLETTILLCVFENSRADAQFNTGIHATAAGMLLSLRRPAHTQGRSLSAVIFERICVESFLYHSTLMMLFDPLLDVQHHIDHQINLDRYSPESADETGFGACTTTQPVLDGSYKFFLLIADVTRLARIARSLNQTEVQTWMQLQVDVSRWETGYELCHSSTLYMLAMRILLLKVDPNSSAVEVMEQMQALLRQGLQIVEALDVHQFLIGYLLWPLAVLGSISVNRGEQAIIDKKISSLLCRTRQGLAVRVKYRLGQIWVYKEGTPSTVMIMRLQMLMKGI